MKKVLLVCGSGASSGFLAKNVRIAAKARNIEIDVKARSDAAVDSFIGDIDLLLIGPHVQYMLSDLQKVAAPYHVPVLVIPQKDYGVLDGNAVLDLIVKATGQ